MLIVSVAANLSFLNDVRRKVFVVERTAFCHLAVAFIIFVTGLLNLFIVRAYYRTHTFHTTVIYF